MLVKRGKGNASRRSRDKKEREKTPEGAGRKVRIGGKGKRISRLLLYRGGDDGYRAATKEGKEKRSQLTEEQSEGGGRKGSTSSLGEVRTASTGEGGEGEDTSAKG